MESEDTYIVGESGNTYIADPESRSEKARLMRQGQLLTRTLGLWPTHLDITALVATVGRKRRLRVLDVGCATGEWPLTVAAKHLHDPIDIIGIDISELMVEYAIAEANNRGLPNVSFRVMNALQPLAFESESFDIINIRIALAFVPRQKWPALIAECYRLLQRGGTLISIESEGSRTNSDNPATERVNRWISQALDAVGLAFWDGVSERTGIHPMQLAFFRDAGFQSIQEQLTILDSSFGTADYIPWIEHQKVTLQAIEPVVVGKLGISKQEFDETLQTAQREIKLDTFMAQASFYTVTGEKR